MPGPRRPSSVDNSGSWLWNVVILVALSLVAWTAWNHHPHNNNHNANVHEDHELQRYHDPFNQQDRCTEQETVDVNNKQQDNPLAAGVEKKTTSTCNCPDPLTPLPRPDDQPEWKVHHEAQAQQVLNLFSQDGNHNNSTLDVLFLGDSITERWRGTSGMGHGEIPEVKQVFDQYFGGGSKNSADSDNNNSTLRGLALATAGDISVELAWHLENGWWPWQQPHQGDDAAKKVKMVVLLIGTNDLGRRSLCSKRNALVGILHVALHLNELQPDLPILFHGLLPRAGGPGREGGDDLTLGEYWDKIMWINRELRHLSRNHKHWYYMDSASVFLRRNKEEHGRGEMQIRADLLPDGVHPSVEGYRKWAPRLAHVVKSILAKVDGTAV